jgi:hypothetical protein
MSKVNTVSRKTPVKEHPQLFGRLILIRAGDTLNGAVFSTFGGSGSR